MKFMDQDIAFARKAIASGKATDEEIAFLDTMIFMKRKLDESTVIFRVIIAGAGRQRNYDFKLQVGPGDNGEPVITIMLPSED